MRKLNLTYKEEFVETVSAIAKGILMVFLPVMGMALLIADSIVTIIISFGIASAITVIVMLVTASTKSANEV